MGINGIGSDAWRMPGAASLSGTGSGSAAAGSAMSALSGVLDAGSAAKAAETAIDGATDESFASALRKAYDEGDKKELKEVCEQFESIMMSMMYKQMKSTVPESSFIERSQGIDIFEDMLDDELMDRASSRGLGLADLMYKQLSRQMDRVVVPGKAGETAGGEGAAASVQGAGAAAVEGATANTDSAGSGSEAPDGAAGTPVVEGKAPAAD